MMGLFKRNRKIYAQLYSREMVMTRKQNEEFLLRDALEQVIQEIEDQDIEITDSELEHRIDEVCKAFGISSPKRMVKPKEKHHTCSQCGAPLKDGKCEYCGTDYN